MPANKQALLDLAADTITTALVDELERRFEDADRLAGRAPAVSVLLSRQDQAAIVAAVRIASMKEDNHG